MPKLARRTQEERSAQTRTRLLDATLECLVELGYARTTTTVVAERAGVSRGAQLHHFHTKEDLVLAAVEHVFDRRNAEFRAAFQRLPEQADRASAAIELLWKFIGGPTFYAWLELAVAGRTDPTLGRRLRQLGARSSEEVERTFRDLFGPPREPNAFFDLAPTFTFAVLQGLAIDRLLVARPRHRGPEVLELIKSLSSLAFPKNAGGAA